MKNDLRLFSGILGGGQLAWLLNLSAKKFGIRTRVWDPAADASGFREATDVHCSTWDAGASLEGFCRDLDMCTLEWESIPAKILNQISASGLPLMPSAEAVEVSSSRILERQLFTYLGFGLAPWMLIDSAKALTDETWKSFWERSGADSAFLKQDHGGYDGKGQTRLSRNSNVEDAIRFFNSANSKGIVEAKVDLAFEISVIAARNRSGQISILGLFENEHENGILRVSRLVADHDERFDRGLAMDMMKRLLSETQYVGTAALELFVDKSGKIFANEWAPRVHNSGHVTLDTYEESQFDFHWRALADLEFPENPVTRKGLMVNVLADDFSGDVGFTKSAILEATDPMPFLALYLRSEELSAVRRVVPYDYGKSQLKPGRKMGHLNVLF